MRGAMPTKTKPKRLVDPCMMPGKIKDADRTMLMECTNIDLANDPEKAKQLIANVEKNLTYNLNLNMLRRVSDKRKIEQLRNRV